MRRFFLQNILFVLFVNLLVKPVWIFFIDRTVQNRLGAAEYGSYIALLNLALILQILLDFGLGSYNTRLIAAQPKALYKMFPHMFWARILLAVIYMIVVVSIGRVLGYSATQLGLLASIMLIQVFNSLVQLMRSCIVGLHRYKTDAVFSALDKVLMIIICGTLLIVPAWSNQFSIWWFVVAQQVSYALTFLTAFLLLKKLYPLPLHFRINVRRIARVLRLSLPYAILVLLMATYIRLDILMLERWLPDGDREAGLYGAAFRLLDAANILGLSLAGVLLPLFGKMNANGESVAGILQLATNFILPVTYTVIALCFFNGQAIMEFLMHETAPYSGKLLSTLMFAFPAYCLMYIFSTLLTAIGKLRPLIVFATFALIINVVGNAIFIPREGALSAAKMAAITQWSIALLCVGTCMKMYKLQWANRNLLKHVCFFLLVFLSAFLLKEYAVNWFWAAVVLILITLTGFVLFQFFAWSAWRQLLQKRKTV